MNDTKTRLLVVEDDPNMGILLEENLQIAGYSTTLATDGMEAVDSFRKQAYDLCLLDIMLPKKDGLEVARDIRKIDPEAAFMFITARSMRIDRIAGFKAGCDDYITKPFELEELIYRIKAILMRIQGTHGQRNSGVILFGRSELTVTERQLITEGKKAKLNAKETAVLQLLANNLNEPVSRTDMLRCIWGEDNYFTSKSMDVYMSRVRRILKQDSNLFLKNIHGFGYKLEDHK